MHYEVKINEFEGPLDLLLHLIKKSNIDIYDISLVEITNQYLDYINKMEELNLDIASEYLVLASELLQYKSSMLLPKKEEEQDDYEEDFKSELIKKLVDYKKYKEVCETFKVLEENRSNFYTKTPSDISLYGEKSLNNDNVTVDDLIDAFKKFMERREFEKPLNTKITRKELSVSDRVVEIRNILRNKKSVNFMELFTRRDKSYVVVTFLSILEMAKDLEISIEQDNNFNDIIIKSCK